MIPGSRTFAASSFQKHVGRVRDGLASYVGGAPRPIRQAVLAERLTTADIDVRSVWCGMEGIAFSVTLVRPGTWPSVEVGAYEYVGLSLPSVGETVTVRKAGGDEERRGYVTRVMPWGTTPISVTETT